MIAEFIIAAESIEALKNLEQRGENFTANLVKTVNDVTRRARTTAHDEMIGQVNLPHGYLAQRGGKLKVSQYATPAHLEGRVWATGENIGLARYGHGGQTGKAGVAVSVKRSNTIFLSQTFYIDFNTGKGVHRVTGQESGVVLATRLRPGERISNKVKQTDLGGGLHIFDAPSVAQLLSPENGFGIGEKITPELVLYFEERFRHIAGIFPEQ